MESDLRPVLDRVAAVRGFRCDAYKETCLRRRLAVRMRARGVHTYHDYAAVLDADGAEFDRLLSTLTVNVTSFYRNAETWQRLAEVFLPVVWDRAGGEVRCWSAGCATGAETQTVAILLAEEARRRGVSGADATVVGTDVDEESLARADRGVYPASAVTELPDELRQRYLEPVPGSGEWCVRPFLRKWVRFRRHDLVQDEPPGRELHLVICRNVVIYFDRDTQERLFHRLADAMAPGGYLVLGKTETLLGASARERFQLEDVRERVYCRR